MGSLLESNSGQSPPNTINFQLVKYGSETQHNTISDGIWTESYSWLKRCPWVVKLTWWTFHSYPIKVKLTTRLNISALNFPTQHGLHTRHTKLHFETCNLTRPADTSHIGEAPRNIVRTFGEATLDLFWNVFSLKISFLSFFAFLCCWWGNLTFVGELDQICVQNHLIPVFSMILDQLYRHYFWHSLVLCQRKLHHLRNFFPLWLLPEFANGKWVRE